MFDPSGRNQLVATTRHQIYDRCGLTLFPHQAEWQLATEGWTLTDQHARRGLPFVNVLHTNPLYPDSPESATVVPRLVTPRTGGVARVAWDLASYKSGKSFSAAGWMSGFVFVPGARVEIIGLEYSSAEPEFEYLEQFLLSERGPLGLGGLNLPKNRVQVHHNDPDHGRMQLKIARGANFLVRSWNRKDALKGKKVTAYVYAEAYQLPGLSCFTSVSQNLRELAGFAVFPTTPDEPWVAVGHRLGHGTDPEWHCTCGVDAKQNPYSYSQKDRDRDNPDKGGILTREKYDIAWCGLLGHFVGRVYNYQTGQQLFTPGTHPQLYRPDVDPSRPETPAA